MFSLAFAFVAATAFTDTHQRDIACVVEIAVLADGQRRGVASGTDVRQSGKRWTGIVGDRIAFESGQPRELVVVAITETAQARAASPAVNENALAACIRQMNSELAIADAASGALPKPVRTR